MSNSLKLLLSVHIAATVSVLGGDLALLVLGTSALAGTAPAAVFPAAHRIAAWLIAPLAVLSLASGLLLASRGGWGIARHGWVTAKLAITLALTAAMLLVLLPGLEQAAATATREVMGRDLPAVTPLRLVVASTLASLLLAVSVALAVFKPGSGTRPAHPGGRSIDPGAPASDPSIAEAQAARR